MPDVHTQTPMTGNRIDTVLKELGRLRRVKYDKKYNQKKRANKLIVDQIGKSMAKHIVRAVQKTVSPEGKGNGEEPSNVILGPSVGDSLAVGDIDLPEEVANDELDDLFLDVTLASTPQRRRARRRRPRLMTQRRTKRGQASRTMGHSPAGRQKEV